MTRRGEGVRLDDRIGPVSTCKHCGTDAVMWVDVHGLNMANLFRTAMLRKDCRACGKQHSLGSATPPPDYERSLAIVIADIHALWPNAERKADEAVEIWADNFEVAP